MSKKKANPSSNHPTDPCGTCSDADGAPVAAALNANGTVTVTYCTGDWNDNVWTEGASCLLDTYSVDDIIYVLQRNPKARDDLRRITSDPDLLALLDSTPMIGANSDVRNLEISARDPIFLYSIFRGNPPGQ